MIANAPTRIVSVLLNNRNKFLPILGFPLTSENARQLDLSVHNKELQKCANHEEYSSTLDFKNFIWLGGYGEERNIYSQASLFSQDARCIHLGVDIAQPASTPIYAPLNGRIHSFKNNDKPFDYGPTIILEHVLGDDDVHFYTLYGHLSLISLKDLSIGQSIEAGQIVGYIGEKTENGGWNPHLHFQIISDMDNMQGDYPGVASKAEALTMLHRCPDPQLILGFPEKPIIY
ncbi:unnamed protein product [Rotaria magnacalcarata]|uniref:M23ase beta-sheet core domain-containing protein n=1 Tax=Rotaria magnacalcarata TaxID=392030 RepID=A0A816DE45_9BILA|nr:unnamed protein product [Rotaria magnacalcarata]CAF2066585.1 unnamed protein product [Rotaria magnacalcarata]CAF2079354.1 unnamed protein product [Rotaria magnacalcarata]CAF3971164.1 unnamed protein product [Rotaria magnacalcarata]CAF4127289.1 unnamed protein product [Rotaria magnacalcarata]